MGYERVINDSLWTFDQHLFVFEPLGEDVNPHDVVLNQVDFWIQVYDLPVGFMSEQDAKEIGNFIGQFIHLDPRNFNGQWKTFIRIRVKIDVSKSLKRMMKIKKKNQEESWLNFKYEKLPNFCFFCSIIGHSEKFCVKLYQFPDKNVLHLFGTWLNAPSRRQSMNISQQRGGSAFQGGRSAGGGHTGVQNIQGPII